MSYTQYKIIGAVVLIVIGAHLLLYGFIRRKMAAAKAEAEAKGALYDDNHPPAGV